MINIHSLPPGNENKNIVLNILTNITENLCCKDIRFRPVNVLRKRINTGAFNYLMYLPHLALPLAASKGEMPLAQEVK